MPASKTAAADLSVILGATPEVRREWYATISPDDFRQLCLAARAQLGTPYGLFQDDALGFIEIVLGETLWTVQRAIVTSVVDNVRTAVPSAADAGKSTTASRLALWWGSVWPVGTAKIVTTADSDRRVVKELWPHIRFAHNRAGLPGVCLTKEWQIGDLKFPVAYGYSPSAYDEAAFSGIHAPHLLVIVDEAGAISPTVGRSIEGMLAHGGDGASGHVRLLLIGNPAFDETATPWFEERCNSPSYNVIHIPAAVTPNFTGEPTPPCRIHPDLPDHPISDHLISRRWVEELRADYGETDPYYIARVLAQFPKDLANKVIPWSFVEQARDNESPDRSTWVRMGIDPAADGGDKLAIARAEGWTLRVVHEARMPPGVEVHDVAGVCLEHMLAAEEKARELGESRRVRVKVDAIGIGWGVATTLTAWGREGRHSCDVVPVNVAQNPDTPNARDRYQNKRAEMWYLGRDLCEQRPVGDNPNETTAGPPTWRLEITDTCARQLSSPNVKYHSSGKRMVESKPDMRARGVASPDEAEAVLLAVYEPRPAGRARLGVYPGQLPRPGDNN